MGVFTSIRVGRPRGHLFWAEDHLPMSSVILRAPLSSGLPRVPFSPFPSCKKEKAPALGLLYLSSDFLILFVGPSQAPPSPLPPNPSSRFPQGNRIDRPFYAPPCSQYASCQMGCDFAQRRRRLCSRHDARCHSLFVFAPTAQNCKHKSVPASCSSKFP